MKKRISPIFISMIAFILLIAGIPLTKQRADMWQVRDAYLYEIICYHIQICEPVLECSDYEEIEGKYSSEEMKKLTEDYNEYWREYEEYCRSNNMQTAFSYEKEHILIIIDELSDIRQITSEILLESPTLPLALFKIQTDMQPHINNWNIHKEVLEARMGNEWWYFFHAWNYSL